MKRFDRDTYIQIVTSNIKERCSVHEVGHTLGLHHTMKRFDRDSYIQLVMRNINPILLDYFAKVIPTYVEVNGLTYDYGSVMHYDEHCVLDE
ncbi:unnamed protein product [Angiostrongylus costaricensis]|uniref:Metalloendopeptidase n=1 Tax=Angiostrongylus costaricensis TaxID=334426 RepID=A0A0R3PFS5_ANGCS|nr:unnamed protein product [Angiostrongylus costaricensis]